MEKTAASRRNARKCCSFVASNAMISRQTTTTRCCYVHAQLKVLADAQERTYPLNIKADLATELLEGVTLKDFRTSYCKNKDAMETLRKRLPGKEFQCKIFIWTGDKPNSRSFTAHHI